MPKEVKSKAATAKLRHAPLAAEIESKAKKAEGKFSRAESWKLAAERRDRNEDVDDLVKEDKEYLDAKTSKRILQQAQQQREEEEAAAGGGAASVKQKWPGSIGANLMRSAGAAGSDSESEEEPDDDEGTLEGDEWAEMGGEDGYMDIADMGGMTDAERAVMDKFFGHSTSERRTINDLILDKIKEKEMASEAAVMPGATPPGPSAGGLPPKVVQVYTEIGKLLKHYRAGKLPKAFKIIPALSNWEEVLWLTKPDEWSPKAVYAATRVFASNLNERMAQRFYNLILLGRVQRDIEENDRLNFHLYEALKKAVYKPAAFYKGILLPLANSECSIKEATVMASVLSKVSVPANHSAVALLKLTEMPYSGPTSLFVRVLLNKKYALPLRVIDSVANHFAAFESERRVLPVLWHQSLLTFAQRYKHDLTVEQKERLKGLFKAQFHPLITPEVRREIFSGHSRGEQPGTAQARGIMEE